MKKILCALVILGLVASESLCLVESSHRAVRAAGKTQKKTAETTRNINKANTLLNQGKTEEAKDAVDKAAASATKANRHATTTSIATGKTGTKVKAVAAITPDIKKATQEAKKSVKEAEVKASDALKKVKELHQVAKNAKKAHDAGNTSKAKEHTNKSVGLITELKQIIEDLVDHLFHTDAKVKSVDNKVKAQMVNMGMMPLRASHKKRKAPARKKVRPVTKLDTIFINGSG